jgi:hypothetical protein
MADESMVAKVKTEPHQSIEVGNGDGWKAADEGKPRSQAENQQQDEDDGFPGSLHTWNSASGASLP